MKKPYKLAALPDDGEHMTLEDFIKYVESGCFVNDDGYGDYATSIEISNLLAIPSRIKDGKINRSFTHVVWFNR